MPHTVSCRVCAAAFTVSRYRFVRSMYRYCSKKCDGIARTKQIEVRCSTCGTAFMRRRDKASGRIYCSRVCQSAGNRRPGPWSENVDVDARRAYFRAYYQANSEKLRERSAASMRRNRPTRNRLQQMRRAGGTITQAEWDAILRAHDGRCAHCRSHEKIQMDHIVPVARGGLTVVGNLQPLCAKCNRSKGARV